jgi:hypothetical protein
MNAESSKIAIYSLVRNWFRQLNDHAPLDTLTGMLCQSGFEMKFPEAVINNQEGFEKWYTSVTHTFFDQIHEVKNLEIDLVDNEANVTVYVNWQARTWQAPSGYSEQIDSDAFQIWKVVDEQRNGDWKIKYYSVEGFIENK